MPKRSYNRIALSVVSASTESIIPGNTGRPRRCGWLDAALLKRLQVLGLPTILFFNAEGQEQPERRVTGFMDAAAFSAHLRDWQA